MSYNVTVIPGDGIGPEIIEATKLCLQALSVDIVWEPMLAGEPALQTYGNLLPEQTLESIRRNKIALKGPITTPIGKGFRSINVALRQELDLYACVRPARSIEGANIKHHDVDLILVRENTEDLYAGVEFAQGDEVTEQLIEHINKISVKKVRKDSAISIKSISVFATEKIIRFAFELAQKQNRKKVTCVQKANIMKYTDGLFLKVFKNIAAQYPKIEASEILVDNLAMQLVTCPQQFDVLVLPNLYGDIISDLCAGLVGGLGVAAGANIGDGIALFEAVHGSAPKYAGKNKVNPAAMILSAGLMLHYLGEDKKAEILEKAVRLVIREGKQVTYDLKPAKNDPSAVGTKEMAAAIVKKIAELTKSTK